MPQLRYYLYPALPCAHCGGARPHAQITKRRPYCSRACRDAAIKPADRFCPVCGDAIWRQNKQYCSRSCHAVGRTDALHPHLNHSYFAVIATPVRAYWLGFLLADGCVSPGGSNNRIQLLLAERDHDHLVRFCEAVGADAKHIERRVVNGFGRGTLRFSSYDMVSDLLWHGVTPRKSKTARFPRLGDAQLQNAALKGYYDGNGSSEGPAAGRIATGSLALAHDILRLYRIPAACLARKGSSVWTVRVPVPLLLEMEAACPGLGLERKTAEANARSLRSARYRLEDGEPDAAAG